ncbi:MAG: DUF4922 domain-containing protein [Bacteroidota bacterium]|nr:DUF4922 domain-containing protein [Bacteroidota bacterium]
MNQLLELIRKKSAAQVLREFAELQKLSWPLAATNYEGLKTVKEKQFQFDGFQVKVQFNPERMRSSAAKVDKQSIAERKCFLCIDNRPAEQDAIAFGNQFLILVNPFPIFNTHFTISCNSHIDQRFIPNVRSLLELARAMEGFTVFYNGPECGASAPDHLHFQAGENGFMPIGDEFDRLKSSARKLFSGSTADVWAFDNYLRKMISVETNSMEVALKIIGIYYTHFQAMQPEKMEPMMNALCTFSGGKWTIHLFPRKLHRPRQFFAEGNDQLLISPASVDFGGVFITPRKVDFDKITIKDIEDIYNQVSLNPDAFQELTEKIRQDLNRILI